MATWLSLDLSIKSTGWAMWSTGAERAASGTWPLAADVSWRGRAYCRLHRNLMDLHRVTAIDHIVFEEPLPHAAVKGNTTIDTLAAMAGLAAHAESFAEAVGASHRSVNMATWRRHFLGSMPRGTKTLDLKAMAMTRCRELGFDPAKHDEAEAIGLLDYAVSLAGVIAPWRAVNILQRQLVPATERSRT